ncbi:MAG: tetratricopeptide repeat protein [Pseudomonadota bacterium]
MFADERGHTITTSSEAAAGSLARGMHNYLAWKADVMPHLQAAIAADPDCALAHISMGLIIHGGRNIHFRPKLEELFRNASRVAAGLTRREQLYLHAFERALAGDIAGSVACYETILGDYPLDIFAQRMAQMELFWIGEMDWSENISARVAPAWISTIPGHHIHLSCRAFDLEETHRYAEAERLGRLAVEGEPTEVWGTHAVAHVLIMQNRIDEGIAWLDGLKDQWSEANQIIFHLWWHRCLFHYERGDTEAILDYYDRWIRNREHPILKTMPDLYIDMQNGASMLLRVELLGVDVGDRWSELAELALNRVEDHTSPFTSAHYAAILAAAGKFEDAQRLVASMRAFAQQDEGTFGPRYRAAVIPSAEAAIAHRKGNYDEAVDKLLPARRMIWQMGGSHAQRNVFQLIFVDAARRAGRKDAVALALQDAAASGFAEAAERIGYRHAAELLN